MIIYDKININQIKQTALSESINKDSSRKKQQEDKNNSKSKTNNTNSNLKIKASIINSDQRNIQEKISQIQIQEQEISQVESTLNMAKTEYLKAIQSQNSEELKQRIKVKELNKDIQDIEQQSTEVVFKTDYVQDDQKAIDIINETMKKVHQIKNTLSKYKSQLMALDEMIQKNKSKIDNQQKEIQRQLGEIECITEEIIINPLDFIFIQGNITTGITINVYV